jgi:hypothetical protein
MNAYFLFDESVFFHDETLFLADEHSGQIFLSVGSKW